MFITVVFILLCTIEIGNIQVYNNITLFHPRIRMRN